MNIEMKHEDAKAIVDGLGWDAFIDKLNEMFDLDFYKCSTDWYEDRAYICKVRGAKGDIIIQWEK